jgi:hypothetical protein
MPIYVRLHAHGIDHGQPSTHSEQFIGGNELALRARRDKFCDRSPTARDGETLAMLDSIQDLASVRTEIALADGVAFTHSIKLRSDHPVGRATSFMATMPCISRTALQPRTAALRRTSSHCSTNASILTARTPRQSRAAAGRPHASSTSTSAIARACPFCGIHQRAVAPTRNRNRGRATRRCEP